MIVNQTDAGWQVINQQAHGLLAVQLALPWQTDKRPIHWVETLIALTEHDDGQAPWEGRNHLTKAGAPLPFQFIPYSVSQSRRLVEIGLEKSRWNALLVSMHTSFLYEPKRGTDPNLDTFLDEQQTNQQKWRKETRATKAETTYAYAFLQWCDAMSLILCRKQVPPEGRRLEVSEGPGGVPYFLHQRSDDSLALDPWPFEPPIVTVHIETFELTQPVFESDQQLFEAIQQAPVTWQEWTFRK